MTNFKKKDESRNCRINPKITEEDIVEYVLERFEDLKRNFSMEDLIKFHSCNKYLLMSHNYEKLKILGNIVANHKKEKIDDILLNYEKILKLILNKKPTVKTHTNVLLHIFGFFKTYFSKEQKRKVLNHIEKYRENKIPLGTILCLMEPETYKINSTYLVSQTYFLLYAESTRSNHNNLPIKLFTSIKE